MTDSDPHRPAAHAVRVALLIDGSAYFPALRWAIARARRSIVICGWDVDARTDLDPEGTAADGLPRELGPCLAAAARQHPPLDIRVLAWDYAFIYSLERDLKSRYQARWEALPGVRFLFDDAHPPGASQHQKLVVIDRELAFCGGMDLTLARWDTPAHAPADERRRLPDGAAYRPFHDVQWCVSGPAAAALGDIADRRWAAAGGITPPAGEGPPSEAGRPDAANPDDGLWPPGVEADFRDLPVRISETLPTATDAQSPGAVQRAYVELIGRARRLIYIENQYLSSRAIAQVLQEALARESGPEIVLVLPYRSGGWMEQMTMGVLRSRLVEQLRAADRHHRLRLYYPRLADPAPCDLVVHAKLMIVDDAVLHAGSANLSNRSMGFDSECDLTVQARDADERAAIRALRRRLLAEHNGCSVQQLAAAEEQQPTLAQALAQCAGEERRLEAFWPQVDPALARQLPDSALIDPERVLDTDEWLDRVVGAEPRRLGARTLGFGAALLLTTLALVVLWRYSPLAAALEPAVVAHRLRELATHPAGGPVGVLLFVAAGLVGVPLMLRIVATVLLFGPVLGVLWALTGGLLGALADYAAGRWLGRRRVEAFAGRYSGAVLGLLRDPGIPAIVLVRTVPVAPYLFVNLLAGALAVPVRDYLAGTLLGLLPGVVAMGLFGAGLFQVLADPSPQAAAVLAGLVALIALAGWRLRKRVRR